jgi:hypothetical protein
VDDRLARDVEALAIRVRELEALNTPGTRALVGQVGELQQRVGRINEEGATATRGELARLNDRIADLREDIQRLERSSVEQSTEGKQLRRGLLIALAAAALSLGGSLILWAITRAAG